ncbi:MAG TPA: hypothetical protein VGK73_00695 [Polyangiaceae bacterium]
MPALVPEVGGFLQATSLSRLLAHALDCRFAGTLVLEESSGFRHGVQFEAGVPRKAKTGCPVAFLGDVLVELGLLSSALHQSTLERALAEKRLHGQVLLAERAVSERGLGTGLREQLLRQILWMFGRPRDTRFGFFPGADLLENWGAVSPVRTDAMELIWRGLRDHEGAAEIDRALAEIADKPLTLREDLPLDYFFFMGQDRMIVERLQSGPQSFSELVASSDMAEERVARVVCLLALTRALDFGVRSAPPLGLETNEQAPLSIPGAPRLPKVTSSVPPGFSSDDGSRPPAAGTPPVEDRSTPAPTEFRQPPLEPAASPTSSAPPEPPESIAPLEASLPPPLVRSSIPDVVTQNLRLKELARKRAARPDATDAERVQAAAGAFERAEALASHGNLAAAKRELALALEHDPQPPYLAMNAWLDSQAPAPDLRRIARELERAYRLAENHPTVRWYRGLILQRLGKHASALQEFRFVLDKLPRHIDAARQVRIYETRLRESPKDRPSLAPENPAERPRSGLFSWLRKAKP